MLTCFKALVGRIYVPLKVQTARFWVQQGAQAVSEVLGLKFRCQTWIASGSGKWKQIFLMGKAYIN